MAYNINHITNHKRPLPEAAQPPAKRARYNPIEIAESPQSPQESAAKKADDRSPLPLPDSPGSSPHLYISESQNLTDTESEDEQFVTKGQAYLKQKEYEEALLCLSQVSGLYHDIEEINCDIGLCHLKLGQFPEAEPYLRQVFEPHPKFYEAQYFLGCVYSNLNDITLAITHFKSVPSFDPNFPDAQLYLADIYQNMKSHNCLHHIEAACQSKFATNTHKNLARYLLVLHHAENNEFAKAEEYLNNLTELRPKYYAQYNLGRSYYKANHFEAAIRCFEKVISDSELFVDAQTLLIKTYQAMNPQNWPKCLEHSNVILQFRFASDLDKNYARLIIGLAMYHNEDYQHAIESLKKVEPNEDDVDLNRDHFVRARICLGQCYRELGDYDTAIKQFKLSLAMLWANENSKRQQEECQYWLGVSLERNGQLEEASLAFMKVIEYRGTYQTRAQIMLAEL
jgi:tetratricopeptide (TPR) repeat protein